MTADTGHLVLDDEDAAQIISDYFPRIAEVHLKDTYAKYRGNTSTPTQEEHRVASVYHNLGGGGVDFPAVFKLLRNRHFKGWAIFDMDGPRKGDDGFENLTGLQVNLHQPARQGIVGDVLYVVAMGHDPHLVLGGDEHSLRGAQMRPLLQKLSVRGENLDAVVLSVADVDAALGIDG